MAPRDDSDTKNFAGAMLYGRDFTGQGLDGANFAHANLDTARMNGAHLRTANFRAARFCKASLRDANLENADLRHAVLGETTVAGASFKDADLRFASLYRLKDWQAIACIAGANLHGVRDAPEGFVAWALENGAIDVAPPPPAWGVYAERLWTFLRKLGSVLRALNSYLDLMPFSERPIHCRVARRGTRAIERYRTRHDLRHMNLEGASLRGAKLAGAPLAGAHMRGIDLSNADLCGATLGQNLNDGDLSGADLSYATISGELRDANLQKASLKGAMAMMADFSHADLRGANLDAADFGSARFFHTDLRDCDCSHTSFDSATLQAAQLEGAILADASFYEGSLIHCDLAHVDFARANLSNADLKGSTNFQKIRSIKGASIYGVRNAPDGFVAWALAQGAVEEHRNRSWTPLDDRRAKAVRTREEMADRKQRKYSARRILWAPALVGVLFLVTGLGGAIMGAIVPAIRGFQMLDWEAVECDLMRAHVEPVHYAWLPRIEGIELSRPVVAYRYTWEARNFDGQRFRAESTVFTSASEAEAFAERYAGESAVICFVNPNNPAEAVLEKAPLEWIFMVVFLASALWTAAGVAILLLSLKHYDQRLY
jgi:uncharacterized protein YjbI with pentapeptide repeats